MNRYSSLSKQVGQDFHHFPVGQPSLHPNSQAFLGELIDHIQDPEGHAVVRPGMHEIITPDMLGKQRPQSDHRTILEPQSSSLGLFLGDFQPFLPPNSLHSLVVDDPALISQQGSHSAVSIATILAGQIDDPGLKISSSSGIRL
jgi:hypothetical protein